MHKQNHRRAIRSKMEFPEPWSMVISNTKYHQNQSSCFSDDTCALRDRSSGQRYNAYIMCPSHNTLVTSLKLTIQLFDSSLADNVCRFSEPIWRILKQVRALKSVNCGLMNDRKSHRCHVRNTKRKRSLARTMHSSEDNIKTALRVTWCEDIDSIHLTQSE